MCSNANLKKEISMSLFCDETWKDIEYGDILMAGTRDDVDFFSALSQEILCKIPYLEKRQQPCGPEDEGVNIYYATSTENIIGTFTTNNYSLVNFKLGDFVFSISKETAEKYLPKHYSRYLNKPTKI